MDAALVFFSAAALGCAFFVGFAVCNSIDRREAARMRAITHQTMMEYATQLRSARAIAKQLVEELK